MVAAICGKNPKTIFSALISVPVGVLIAEYVDFVARFDLGEGAGLGIGALGGIQRIAVDIRSSRSGFTVISLEPALIVNVLAAGSMP